MREKKETQKRLNIPSTSTYVLAELMKQNENEIGSACFWHIRETVSDQDKLCSGIYEV